jgi:putative transposase
VLTGEVKPRCQELLVQLCDAEDVLMLSRVVSKDHVHMHLEYPLLLSVSDLVKRLKGRTSRLLLGEFPDSEKRYWGQQFWSVGCGAWSTGKVTEKLVQEIL